MEWEQGALADRAAEEGDSHPGCKGNAGHSGREELLRSGESERCTVDRQRAEIDGAQSQTDNETEIADAVDDERLDCGVGCLLSLEPESDEEIAANSDQFPEDEHDEQVGA